MAVLAVLADESSGYHAEGTGLLTRWHGESAKTEEPGQTEGPALPPTDGGPLSPGDGWWPVLALALGGVALGAGGLRLALKRPPPDSG